MTRLAFRRFVSALLVGFSLSCSADADGVSVAETKPSAELKASLEKYGFKSYSCSDGSTVFNGLFYQAPQRGSKKVPLLVYIPGSGERGDPIRQFRQHALFDIVTGEDFQRAHPCHLLAISPPQEIGTLQGGSVEEPSAAQRLMCGFVRHFTRQRNLRIDETRLYLTGFSYGGSGAYALALHYPGLFAAVVPIAGLPPRASDSSTSAPGNWWHFHNEGDYARHGLDAGDLDELRKRILAAGGDFRVGTFPRDSHDAWTSVWREASVWSWMFAKSTASGRNGRPSAGKDIAGRTLDLSHARCSASVAGQDAKCGPERVVDGLHETFYRPSHAFGKNDWWMAEFEQPVSGTVRITSGDRNGRDALVNALVEVSSDGKRWNQVGRFPSRGGSFSFNRSTRFGYLRIRSVSDKTPMFVLNRVTVVQK